MKTTLVIDDGILRRLKADAVQRGHTLSATVEAALRLFLERAGGHPDLPDLPTWTGGQARADVDSHGALDRAMEED